jgi:succinate dehydrogenase / fumarate reductase cytochrome b subunit
MRSSRPVYLNLLKIRQPLPAVVSIFHRVSGALLFLLLPFVLFAFEQSLADESSFIAAQSNPLVRLLVFAALASYGYHFLAGLRFLAFDLHRPGLYRHLRASALVVFVGAGLIVLLLGAWLC